MKNHKKTFWGSLIAFFIGTSCCWLSSLAIWVGGATFFGVVIKWIENFQTQIVLLGIILAIISIYLYQKSKRRKPPENNRYQL